MAMFEVIRSNRAPKIPRPPYLEYQRQASKVASNILLVTQLQWPIFSCSRGLALIGKHSIMPHRIVLSYPNRSSLPGLDDFFLRQHWRSAIRDPDRLGDIPIR
jgi:hypothetical protein